MPAAVAAARFPADKLRRIFPENACKELARRVGKSVHTARDWLLWGVPSSERQKLADAVRQRRLEAEAYLRELEQYERELRGRS